MPRWPAAERWGWLELFAAMQLLSGALLFIPDMQQYRMFIRALPYVASLVALAYSLRRVSHAPLPASSKWLLASFAVLAASLLHPDTHMQPGLAQIVFLISIGAPMFWAARTVDSLALLTRLLGVIFVASLVSAAVGVLQVYYPEWFLPPEFSALGQRLNPDLVQSLSFIGPDGRTIVRPPGLSDIPGGAAVAGLITVVFGVANASRRSNRAVLRIFSVGAAAIGMTALYLTQIRALTVMAALAVFVFAALCLRQGRTLQGGWIAAGGVALIAATFEWASAIGGEAIETRFSYLIETGLFTTYQETRGFFLDYTLRELLFQFPFGAGLGRWGMMHVYFTDPAMWHVPPIHVEIQVTGWLLDGGILMWVCYGAALAAAGRMAYRTAVARSSETLQYLATVVFAFQLAIVGLCLTGPVFNTQLGMMFWMVTGALVGARRGWQQSPSEAVGG